MPDAALLGAFLAGATVVSVIWGLSLWYFYERSQLLRHWIFFVMGFTRRRSEEVRAVLLSAVYYVIGLLASLLFVGAFGLSPVAMFSFSATHLPLAILGIVGEISLSNLLVDFGCKVTGQGKPEKFAELKEIPWMKGLRDLPPKAVVVGAALGAMVEELFFRGVLVLILTQKLLVAPWLAVMIAGALFVLEQLVQLRTAFQAMVIGSSCVAISLVGGLLVVATGSVVPAVLCHVSFVVFFIFSGQSKAASNVRN
jgi:hypothetical protein